MLTTKSRDFRSMVDDFTVAENLRSNRTAAMKRLVDEAWQRFAGTGVSWVGFYGKDLDRDEMILLERRDKPACSPIGLTGACGKAWTNKKSLIVTDVAKLGANYIACDPRDRSELVIPMFEETGVCWGVLDVDSHDLGAFSPADAEGFWSACFALGLTAGVQPGVEIV